MRRELGTEPSPASRRLREEILAGHFPTPEASPAGTPSASLQTGVHNVPGSLTSFIEREEIRAQLGATRLLTLTGLGGDGKTRLALQATADLAAAYPDGAWVVELAPLSEGSLVPQAVVAVLGIRERPGRSSGDTLADALREKELLLVLDNCEHLGDAAAHLAEALLESCPRLRVEMNVNWSETTSPVSFSISRTTFFLEPGDTAAAPLE